jgi:hypothetical protein
MTLSIIQARIDAFSNQAFPDRNTGPQSRLRLDGTTGLIKRSFIDFNLPDAVLRGATVTAAVFKLYPRVAAGSTAGEIRRITGPWKEGRLTHNNVPATSTTNAVAFTGITWAGELEFDVLDLVLDAISAGEMHGFRITISTSALRELFSSEAAGDGKAPTLEIDWSSNPPAPSDLRPSGERAVSTNLPTLSWASGRAQSAFEVEVRDVATQTTHQDTGEVVSTDNFYTLTVALTPAEEMEWRVRMRDGDGLWSEFSEWVPFVHIAIGTVTISNPTVGGVVNDSTPPFIWTYSGIQAEVAVILYERDTQGTYVEKHRLSRRTYATSTYTPPQGIITSQDADRYMVQVQVWPDVDFEQIPGAPNHAEAERVFTFEKTASVAGPSSLSAVVGETTDEHLDPVLPRVSLSWERADAPDAFLLLVDDAVVAELDPADFFMSGTSYAVEYFGAVPNTEHIYEIAAVVNNEVSAVNPTDTATLCIAGIWLIDEEEGTFVRISGRDQLPEARGESGETVYPIGRPEPVRYRDSLRGREGSLTGKLIDEAFLSASEAEALVQAMNEKMGRYRLVSPPNRSFLIHIHDVATPPYAGRNGWFAVSLIYEQIADFHRPFAGSTSGVGYSGGY